MELHNEDPDQTAPKGAVWSQSALFVYAILSETSMYKSLGYLRYMYAGVSNTLFHMFLAEIA